jgi:hypothetical protein
MVDRKILAFAQVLSCAPAISLAEDKQLFEMELKELLHVPVIGPTLSSESYKTVSAAVTVFTRDQLDRLVFDYVYELLSLVSRYQNTRGAETLISILLVRGVAG